MALIAPHGAEELRPLIVHDARRGELEAEALTLPSLMISSAAAANAVMMGAGYFTPLSGYMNRADALSVAENMRTTDGLFWPVPVVNLAKSCPVEPGQRLAQVARELVGVQHGAAAPGVRPAGRVVLATLRRGCFLRWPSARGLRFRG